MMGRLERDQKQLFYAFDLDEAVPADHPVRQIVRVLDLSWVHSMLAPHYSHTGRPSIDPELMLPCQQEEQKKLHIRMLYNYDGKMINMLDIPSLHSSLETL